MKKLIENAKSQFKTFGTVRMTHYSDRSYQNSKQLIFSCIDDAVAKIEEVVTCGSNEDMHVPHANYF